MHASRTAPFIDEVLARGNSLTWLFNVLAKKKEAERILYADDQVGGCEALVLFCWSWQHATSPPQGRGGLRHGGAGEWQCLWSVGSGRSWP